MSLLVYIVLYIVYNIRKVWCLLRDSGVYDYMHFGLFAAMSLRQPLSQNNTNTNNAHIYLYILYIVTQGFQLNCLTAWLPLWYLLHKFVLSQRFAEEQNEQIMYHFGISSKRIPWLLDLAFCKCMDSEWYLISHWYANELVISNEDSLISITDWSH